MAHCKSHALAQTMFVDRLHAHLVNHQFDGVVLVAVELQAVQYLAHLAVDTHVQIAFLAQVLEEFAIVALAVPDKRSQQIHAASLVVLQDEVDDLVFAEPYHPFAAQVAECLAGTCIEQSEEVVDLGGGAHCRARIVVHRLLLDADHGRKARNLVHIGAFEVAEEVTRIAREGLNVAALAFGIDGIKCKRRLSRTRKTGHNSKAVTGDGNIYILQVMDSCA